VNLRRVVPARDQVIRVVPAQHPVEQLVGFRVADTDIAFIGLANGEVGRRWLAHDHFGNTEVPGELPDLRLEEITERVDRR
jgi:hypothetical protein